MKFFCKTLKKIVLILCITASVNGEAKDDAMSKEKLSGYLSHLVSMNTTTSDKIANKKAMQWVEEELKSLPLHFKSYDFDGYPALVITTKETKNPAVFLVAHMDVVPAKAELFAPLIKGEKMYGRGAYDMKMAIACYLLLMHDLKKQLPDLNIGIMLTADEEIGGMNGVKRVMEEGYTSKIALLPDGGFNWKFEEAAKGVLQVKLTAKGKSAHGSRPWEGENAIVKLMQVLVEINSYFDEQKILNEGYFPTVNVGLIQGGKSTNQVPDSAEAQLDIRYPPSMAADQMIMHLQKIIKRYPQVSLDRLIEGPPHQEDIHRPPFKQFKQLANKMYGIEIGSVKSHGASDARFFGEKQIPVMIIAPTGGEIHSDEEWVDLEDLARFYQVMKAWVVEFATP